MELTSGIISLTSFSAFTFGAFLPFIFPFFKFAGASRRLHQAPCWLLVLAEGTGPAHQ